MTSEAVDSAPGTGRGAWWRRAPDLDRFARRRLTAEVWIVLGLSLGASALRDLWRIVERLTRDVPLRDQTAVIHQPASPRPYLDLAWQLITIGLAVVPVLLALYLLSESGRSAVRRIGFDVARPVQDLGWGVVLAAVIGVPGVAFYVLGRALGITVQIQVSNLDAYWWTVPILLLSAVKNAVLEEVIAVGYLMERLRDLRWALPVAIVASALLRGTYHLYQGIGPFIGNAIMGIVFAWFYYRYRRVMPLVVAHFLLDLVAFVGYHALPESVLTWIGIG